MVQLLDRARLPVPTIGRALRFSFARMRNPRHRLRLLTDQQFLRVDLYQDNGNECGHMNARNRGRRTNRQRRGEGPSVVRIARVGNGRLEIGVTNKSGSVVIDDQP